MNAVEAIEYVREALATVKKQGASTVDIDRLDGFLAEFKKGAPTMGADEANRNHEVEIERWKLNSATQLEMFKSVIEAGQTALKASLLMNGGAAAALLAFMGGFLTKATDLAAQSPIISGIGAALLAFVLALGFTGTATGFRYLSQAAYASFSERWRVPGHVFSGASIALALASYVGFFYGAYRAYYALVHP